MLQDNAPLTDEGTASDADVGAVPFQRDVESSLTTPQKEANAFMRENKLSPSKHPNLAKELTAYNTLAKQLSSAPKSLRKKILVKKGNKKMPRCARNLSRKLGVHRQNVLNKMRRKRNHKRQEMERNKKLVVTFLKRSDNSVELPSKKDALSKGVTKRALNDTMKNLHKRFCTENPRIKMSLATFCRQRPKWIKSIIWASRRQCLCLKHENGSLKLKAIKLVTSPNVFVSQHTEQDIDTLLEELPDEDINFRVWKSVEISTSEEKSVKKFRLHEEQLPKAEFIQIFKEEFSYLREHISRTTNQFAEIKNLRESLNPDTEVTVQIDYSENYLCSYQNEPSQVFYDKNQITVHPMVVHFTEDGSLKHKSFIGITDVTKHSAPTTVAFLLKLIPEVKKIKPMLSTVHYISDSPANQYRNKYIIKFLSEHSLYFNGVLATWDYHEAGHGKGPCDGVGGSFKKSIETLLRNLILSEQQMT